MVHNVPWILQRMPNDTGFHLKQKKISENGSHYAIYAIYAMIHHHLHIPTVNLSNRYGFWQRQRHGCLWPSKITEEATRFCRFAAGIASSKQDPATNGTKRPGEEAVVPQSMESGWWFQPL